MFSKYRGKPLRFMSDVLGHRLWAAERCIVEQLWEKKRVTVRSGRKNGKTFTIADIVLTFLFTEPCIIVTISPSLDHLKNVMWSRIRAAHKESRIKLPGRPDATQLRLGPNHYAIGVSTDKSERISGFHAQDLVPDDPDDPNATQSTLQAQLTALGKKADTTKLLYVFDEAPGVDQFIYDAVMGSVAGPNVYVVLAGNPILDVHEPHEFCRSHLPGSGYARIKIATFATDDDPVSADFVFDRGYGPDGRYGVPPWILDEEFVEMGERMWGRDSPLFKGYVLGQFSGSSSQQKFVTREMLEASLVPYETGNRRVMDVDLGRHMGVDVARSEGGDYTVAVCFDNGVKILQHKWQTDDLMVSAEIVAGLRVKWGRNGVPMDGACIHVDSTGLGSGVVDRLRQMGIFVDAVDFGASKLAHSWPELCGEMKFNSRKAELYWTFRRALQEGLCVVPRSFEETWEEAPWAEYKITEKGRGTEISVDPESSKKKLKVKYGRSPDSFDADVLAWSRLDRGGSRVSYGGRI